MTFICISVLFYLYITCRNVCGTTLFLQRLLLMTLNFIAIPSSEHSDKNNTDLHETALSGNGRNNC